MVSGKAVQTRNGTQKIGSATVADIGQEGITKFESDVEFII